jgi:hypothetical protein
LRLPPEHCGESLIECRDGWRLTSGDMEAGSPLRAIRRVPRRIDHSACRRRSACTTVHTPALALVRATVDDMRAPQPASQPAICSGVVVVARKVRRAGEYASSPFELSAFITAHAELWPTASTARRTRPQRNPWRNLVRAGPVRPRARPWDGEVSRLLLRFP